MHPSKKTVRNVVPRICYVTTVSSTLRSFVLPSAQYLHDVGGFDVTFVSDGRGDDAEAWPEWAHFFPLAMKRGVDLGAIMAVWRMHRLFHRGHFDIVQFSTPNASLYASLASFSAGVPIRVYGQWGIRYVGFTRAKRTFFWLLERAVCSLATHVEPDSHGNLEFSIRERLYHSGKGRVIWNGSAAGVDLDRFDVSQKPEWRSSVRSKYGIAKGDFVVGFIGRLCQDKGVNELLTAARALFEAVPNASLLLVGEFDSDLDPYLFAWAQECDRVILSGRSHDIPEHLSAMDVLVLASYREGFGAVVVEAEAMGVAVIVTAIPGPLDAVIPDETGLVIPVKDPAALLRALQRLVESSELRSSFERRGPSFVRERFEREAFASHLLQQRRAQLAVGLDFPGSAG